MESNERDRVLIASHRALEERRQVAGTCAARLGLTTPILVDGMDGAADRAFNAWPERLYVVSHEGRVLYQGGKGPYHFDPEELEGFLAGKGSTGL